MCGINGIFSSARDLNWADSIKRMNEKMAHRGPDADGVYHADNITLGHRRLSIIDLDERGNQPMFSHCGRYIIVFNGEIYNFQSLKQGISNYTYRSETDTEVILALYLIHGKNMLTQLEGMFSLAIWDSEQKELLLARDRFGKKPLYWWLSTEKNSLVFSSEVRPILAANLFKPQLNKAVLGQYLQYQTVFDPNTLVAEVYQLPAGNFCVVSMSDQGKISLQINPYYQRQNEITKNNPTKSYEHAVKTTRDLFETAVQKRLVADVDFGAFLSGGIDSSAVVAMMSKHLENPVKTFHVYFDESAFSERQFAEMVAKKFNTDHQNILIQPKAFLEEVAPALEAIDHPSADGINTYVVSKYTRLAGIKMALSGLGGDEVFGGYDVFRRIKQVNKLRSTGLIQILEVLPSSLRNMAPVNGKLKEMISLSKLTESSVYELFRHFYSDANLRLLGIDQKREFDWGIPLRNDNITAWVGNEEIEKYMKPVLLRDTDQMSMAHSLEVRVPFLDHILTDYVMSLPDEFKPLRPGKKLLIDAMGDDLPREIWDRKKMGFVFPWKQWVNQELKEIVNQGLASVCEVSEIEPAIAELRQYQHGLTNEQWHKTWLLSTLGHWIKNNNIAVN